MFLMTLHFCSNVPHWFVKTYVKEFASSTIIFDIAYESAIIRLTRYAGACPLCKGRLTVAEASIRFNGTCIISTIIIDLRWFLLC